MGTSTDLPWRLHSLNVGGPQYAPVALWASFAMLGILHVCGLKYHQAVPSALKTDFDLTDKRDTVTLVKIACHLMAVLTIALAQMILGSSYLFFYGYDSWYALLACGVALATAILLRSVGKQVRSLHMLQRQQKQLAVPDEGAKIVDVTKLFGFTLAGVFIVVASGIAWLGVTMRDRFDNAFLHFRDLNLTSGVALALPIASVLMVMYFGIWAYLGRLAYWEHRYVEMCNLKLDPVIRRDLCVDITAIDKCLLGPLENGSWMRGFALMLGALYSHVPAVDDARHCRTFSALVVRLVFSYYGARHSVVELVSIHQHLGSLAEHARAFGEPANPNSI